MGGRYGGDIKGRRNGNWSTRKALEVIGRETLQPFEAIGARARKVLPKAGVLRQRETTQ